MRRAGSLLLLLIFLLSVRHLLWYRASAGLLLTSTTVEASDSWSVGPSRSGFPLFFCDFQ